MTIAVFEKICKVLDEAHALYTVKSHAEASTSVQAARARGLGADGVRRGAKAMILSADGKLIQCVVPGDVLVDLEKVKALVGAKEVALANAGDVKKATGCVPGCVPPLGNLFNLPVYADTNLAQDMVFSAGMREKSIFMKRVDWEAVARPIVADLAKKK